MKEKLINVAVEVFPDGTTLWHEINEEFEEYQNKVWRMFRENNPKYSKCVGGCVHIRMPESIYNKIHATDRFIDRIEQDVE